MVGMSVRDNLERVRERVATAAQQAGRSASSVRLIAVSKTKSLLLIDEAHLAGQVDFGENYVQEALQKVEVRPSLKWHFIGSLQTNKAKLVVGHFALIHSVDRSKLAHELSKSAQARGVVQDVLLQIHMGDEATKHGVDFEEAPGLIEEIQSQCPGLRLRGLMSLPPLSEDESISRGYFSRLRSGMENWRTRYFSGEGVRLFSELSIGTSSDFEWAVLEGATMVRVGTDIFGARE
jgi:PLP dependent protein